MDEKHTKRIFELEGMTCNSCEIKIENQVKKLKGILDAKASLEKNTLEVCYDIKTVGINEIAEVVEKLGYKVLACNNTNNGGRKSKIDLKTIKQLVIIAVVVGIFNFIISKTVGYDFIPRIDNTMGYSILFVIGLMSSIHCIAMCGGINLSQCIGYTSNSDSRFARLKPSFLYNLGRVISYSIIGGIVGTLGSVISFSGMAGGFVSVLAGTFMVIMGLNIINIFPTLRKLNPRLPKTLGNRVYNLRGKKGPFIVGLLNGLMPCGPLQAMQIYALGTGSFIAGATAMFMFSIGTVPLLFVFGALSTFMSGKLTGRLMKASGILVIVLGIAMFGRGLSLSGISLPGSSIAKEHTAQIKEKVQIVTIDVKRKGYEPIVVQKGIPVKFILKVGASELTPCNDTVVIPAYNIKKELKAGENIIEFTPSSIGNISYTCDMGMLKSYIRIVDNNNL